MRLRIFPVLVVSVLIGMITWVWVPPALAAIQMKVSDIDYKDCPPELAEGAISSFSSQKANCFLVTGIVNNTSGKYIYDADVFGRIYDANDNRVMQNRTRLGGIDEVPPGKKEFEIRISVPTNLQTPLKLKQFKSSGFAGRIGR
ncbi:MAG: hypothetical protein WBA77_07990 [Microcoleaceae cyanobacterium]